jgi:pilus assembly protein CpaB
MKRRVIGVAVALALAAVGTILLVSYVNGAEDRALAGERVVDVLVVSEAVPSGTPAEALAGEVQLERVASKVKARGAVTTLRALDGLVTSTALVPGEQLIRGRFVTPETAGSGDGTSGRSGRGDQSGKLEVSVALALERVVGGTLRSGDTVAVFASTTSPHPDVTHLILEDVVVTNVQGTPSTGSTSSDEEGADPVSSTDKVVVTLALDPAAAESVIWTMEHGTVWLSLDPKGADVSGTRLVTPENVFG